MDRRKNKTDKLLKKELLHYQLATYSGLTPMKMRIWS